MTNQLSLPLVTRVEVIDDTGQAFSRRYGFAGASVLVQDEGRTIKVFAEERQLRSSIVDDLPTREEMAAVIVAAVTRGRELINNPEYGGTVQDSVAYDVLEYLRNRKA